MKISVVIAAYNEAQNIGELTQRLIATLDNFNDVTWELIYVIEGTDETRAIAESFALQRSEIRILYNPEPSGLANAFRKGFDAVAPDTDVVVTMDADLNHQPEEIPRLVKSLFTRNASIVVGSRKVKGSSTEGTPLWKRVLSDAGNVCMRRFGAPVADTTSGFRVYRYNALRQISFGNTGFAFLPEMLMRAHEAGQQIEEEPIQFIFRTAADSKMQLLPTLISYIRLFSARAVSLPTLAAVVVLIAALAIRLLVAFPVHKYQADADGVLAGLCALRVVQGSHPVFFPGGYRLGAQSCYVTAAAFSLFGVSRQSLALTGILFSIFFILFTYLYLREAFGGWSSLAGLLLVAVPPVQLLINTYAPWAYGEILMYCASSLWLATVLARRSSRAVWFFAFGLSSGLALWCSLQSLMITLPLMIWLLLRRIPNSVSRLASIVCGVLIGAAPLWIFLARGGGPKLFADGLTRTSNSLDQVFSNSAYLIFTDLPWLLAERPAHGVALFSGAGITILVYSFAVLVVVILALWSKSPLRRRPALSSQTILLALIVISCACLYVFSAAGSVRGWTVRYILPIYFVVPAMAAILCRSFKRSWLIVVAGIAFVLFINVRDYPFTSSPVRQSLQTSLAADERLLHWLAENHIQAVIGPYWDVYSLNFDSRGSVLGIPVESQFDYLTFEKFLRGRRVKWAVIDHTPVHLTQWQHQISSRGDIFPIGPEHFLFVPDINPPDGSPENFVELARASDPH